MDNDNDYYHFNLRGSKLCNHLIGKLNVGLLATSQPLFRSIMNQSKMFSFWFHQFFIITSCVVKWVYSFWLCSPAHITVPTAFLCAKRIRTADFNFIAQIFFSKKN